MPVASALFVSSAICDIYWPRWTVKLSSRLASDTCAAAAADEDVSIDLNGLDSFTDRAFNASLHSKQESFFYTLNADVTSGFQDCLLMSISVVGSVQQIKLTRVSFWLYVKIASCVVSYRLVCEPTQHRIRQDWHQTRLYQTRLASDETGIRRDWIRRDWIRQDWHQTGLASDKTGRLMQESTWTSYSNNMNQEYFQDEGSSNSIYTLTQFT